MMETILFWTLAGMAVLSALAVIAFRNPVNSVMALFVTLLVTAGIYLQMGAYGIALFQVIVYIGAVLVLFLFVVMILDLKTPGGWSVFSSRTLAMGTAGFLLAGGGAWFAWRAPGFPWTEAPAGAPGPGPAIREIALDLFTRHLLVFELTSVLLLAAAVGAVLIGRKERNRP